MAANSDLQGSEPTNLAQALQSINRLYSAMRGGTPPVNAMGASTNGQVDLGSQQNQYRTIYATNLVVGGVVFDGSRLSGGSGQIVLTPATTGSGLNMRDAGLIPVDTIGMILSGRSALMEVVVVVVEE